MSNRSTIASMASSLNFLFVIFFCSLAICVGRMAVVTYSCQPITPFSQSKLKGTTYMRYSHSRGVIPWCVSPCGLDTTHWCSSMSRLRLISHRRVCSDVNREVIHLTGCVAHRCCSGITGCPGRDCFGHRIIACDPRLLDPRSISFI